jgi:glyoxylase-like metal-dependent hydrolase (beta-lactamase superfamily II)
MLGILLLGMRLPVEYERGLAQVGERTYAFLQPDGGWGWSNAGLVVGDNEAILIDTFMDLKLTQELLDSVAKVTDKPVRKIVNTHHNADHTWGNQLVENATVIGHHRCRAELLTGVTPDLLNGLKEVTGNGAAGYMKKAFAPFDFTGIHIVPPTVTFEDRLWLHPGGTSVRLEYFGPCHTLGDIVAYVPDERVLFTGDIGFIGSTPLVWEGSILNWIETVARIVALKPKVIVPGHGPITDVEGLRSMEAYLGHVVAQGAELKERGLTPGEAAREIDIGDYAGWTDPERIVLNLMRLWLELDGKRPSARIDPLEGFGAMAEFAAERA